MLYNHDELANLTVYGDVDEYAELVARDMADAEWDELVRDLEWDAADLDADWDAVEDWDDDPMG